MTYFILIYLLFPFSVMAEDTTGNWLQLFRLNQSSQQELERIQQLSTGQTAPLSLQYENAREKLNQQQRLELRLLQEDQRHRQLVNNQRRRTTSQGPQDRQKSIFQLQRFRQEQRHHLDRHRIQQQIRNWPR